MDRNYNPNIKWTFEEKEEAIEQKARIIRDQGGLCSKCHLPLTFPAEAAHRIPKSKHNVIKYGWNVINHRYNLRVTHKDCNSGVLIGNARPEEQAKLIEAIKNEMEGTE